MALRMDVSGKTVSGYLITSYKTKHDTLDQQIVTTNQKVVFNDVPLELVQADVESSLRIRVQARIRKLPVNEARGLAGKETIDYMDTRTKLVSVRKMSMEEMIKYLKDHPEEREALLAELEE